MTRGKQEAVEGERLDRRRDSDCKERRVNSRPLRHTREKTERARQLVLVYGSQKELAEEDSDTVTSHVAKGPTRNCRKTAAEFAPRKPTKSVLERVSSTPGSCQDRRCTRSILPNTAISASYLLSPRTDSVAD